MTVRVKTVMAAFLRVPGAAGAGAALPAGSVGPFVPQSSLTVWV